MAYTLSRHSVIMEASVHSQARRMEIVANKIFCDELPYRASSDAVLGDIKEYLQGKEL